MPRQYDDYDDDDDLEENPYADSDTDADDDDVDEVYENPAEELWPITKIADREYAFDTDADFAAAMHKIGWVSARARPDLFHVGDTVLYSSQTGYESWCTITKVFKNGSFRVTYPEGKSSNLYPGFAFKLLPVQNPDDDDVDEVYENPASVVRTARDERLWRMAKASAARQGRARDWPYVMGIFQRMKHHTGGAAMMNPDDEDDVPPPPPSFQLRAAAVQQGLFASSDYEARPQKKKPAAPVDTRQRDLFGLPIDEEPRENPDDYEVAIAYSARPSRGGWIPVVKQNGRVVSMFDPYLLYDKEVAVAIAHDFAQDLASRYVGDWNVSIVAENPDDEEPRENPDDLMQRIAARRQAERARREAQLASMHETMAADPGFQQAVRRRQAEETMQRYAAGPQLFKHGDRVMYSGPDGAIPAVWAGRVIGYEWHPEWVDDGDGHFYIIRWSSPAGTHEGVYHQSDLTKR